MFTKGSPGFSTGKSGRAESEIAPDALENGDQIIDGFVAMTTQYGIQWIDTRWIRFLVEKPGEPFVHALSYLKTLLM